MPVDDPQNFTAQLQSQRIKLKELSCEEDVDAIEDYIKNRKNVTDSTLINHASCLRILSEHAEKPLLDYSGVKLDRLITEVSKEKNWSDEPCGYSLGRERRPTTTQPLIRTPPLRPSPDRWSPASAW